MQRRHPKGICLDYRCRRPWQPCTIILCITFRFQIEIEGIVRHPDYFENGTVWYNDIALLRLSTPARLSRNAQLMCLPIDQNRVAQELQVFAY